VPCTRVVAWARTQPPAGACAQASASERATRPPPHSRAARRSDWCRTRRSCRSLWARRGTLWPALGLQKAVVGVAVSSPTQSPRPSPMNASQRAPWALSPAQWRRRLGCVAPRCVA